MKILNNHREFYDHIGLCNDATFQDAERTIYKHTSCGAWLKREKKGFSMGTIVEGSDVEIGPIRFQYPFYADDFDAAVSAMEESADELWHIENVLRYADELSEELDTEEFALLEEYGAETLYESSIDGWELPYGFGNGFVSGEIITTKNRYKEDADR